MRPRLSQRLLGSVVVVTVAVAVVLVALALGSTTARLKGVPASVVERVGASPMVVTFHESLLELLSPPEIDGLARLEATIARDPRVGAEYGPVTWLRAQLAALRRRIARGTATGAKRADLLVRAGGGSPSIDDPDLVLTLVLGAGVQPPRSVRWLFPDATSARILVRPAHGSGQALAAELRRMIAGTDLVATVGGAS